MLNVNEVEIWAGLIITLIEQEDMGNITDAIPADHTTSVYSGEHTGDPVPIVIGGPHVPASRVSKLSEAAAARGNLGRIRGLDLMPILTDVIGRSRLYGS